tara:strand:+ start:5059 stop:9078 length:4020 start_codon:yes stop_codon:yes gene_type:complete
MEALSEAINACKNRLKSLAIVQKAHNRHAKAMLDQAKAQVNATLQGMINMGSMVRQIGAQMRMVGVALLALTALLVAAWRDLATTGADFEQTMDIVVSVVTELQGVSASAAQQFAALSAEVMRLGQTTNFTASQIATAAQFLGQAGFTAVETTQALEATVNLARAGMLDLARASEITADMVNAYTLQATDAARVSDVFAKAQASANTTVQQLGNAFSFAAPVAATLGQSVEESAIALALLANNSIKSSRAGTGLAQILSGLIRKTADTTELMEKYGSSFEAVDPTLNSVVDIIKEFSRVGVTAADVMKFFGERAGRAMLALMNTPTDEIDAMGEAINDSFGEGLKQATIRWDNLNGSIKVFVSRLEAIKLEVFNRIKTQIRSVVDTAADMLQKILDLMADPAWSHMVKPVMAVVAILTVLTATAGLTLIALGMLFAVWGGGQVVIASMAVSAAASASTLAATTLTAEGAAAALASLAASAGVATTDFAALALAAGTSNAAIVALATTAKTASTAVGGAAVSGMWAALGTTIKASLKAVGTAITAYALPVILTLVAVMTVVVGVMATWEKGVDDLGAKWGTFGSLFGAVTDFISGVITEVVGQLARLHAVWNSLLSSWLTSGPRSFSLWEDFKLVFFQLAEAFRKIFEATKPVLMVFLKLAAAGLFVVFEVFYTTLTVIVEILVALAYALNVVVDSFIELAHYLGILDYDSEELKNRLDEQADAVENLTEKQRKLIDTYAEDNKAHRKQVKDVEEMMSLMSRRDQLNARDLKRLADLRAEYGDGESALQDLIDRTEDHIETLEDQVAKSQEGTLEHAQLTILLDMEKEALRRLGEAQTQYNTLVANSASVLQENVAALDAASKAEKRRNDILKEGEEALEAYKKALSEWTDLVNDAAESRLNSYELEVKKINELKQSAKDLAEAQKEQIKAQQELNDQRIQEEAETAFDLFDEVDAETDPRKKAALQEQLKDSDARMDKLKERKTKLADAETKRMKDEARTQEILLEQEKEARQKVADKQDDILKKQAIQQAKQAGDTLLAAELTAEAEFEADKKRIEDTFLLEDNASQQQKADALKNIEEIRDAKIAAAHEAADEEAKKAEEAAAKEKEQALKALDKTRESLEDKIAASLAKRVTSLREMVALTFTLMRLEAIKEARARKAAKRAASEQARAARLAKIAAADPLNERKQAALLRAQQSARLEALMAGKKLTDAGLTAEAGQAVEQLFAPPEVTQAQAQSIGIFRILDETKLIQQGILDVLLAMQAGMWGANLGNAGMQALAATGPGIGQGPLGADGLTNVTSTTESTSQVDVTINNSFDAEVAEAVVFDAMKNAGLNVV